VTGPLRLTAAAFLAGIASGPPAHAQGQPIAPPGTEQQWMQLTNADWGYYQRMYGDAITMSVDTLLDEVSVQKRQAIRTFGTFQIPMNTMMGRSGTSGDTTGTSSGSPSAGSPSAQAAQGAASTLSFQICGEAKGHRCLTFIPVREIASDIEFQAEAFRGERVMIVGAFDTAGFLSWSFEVMPESARRAKDGRTSGLRALVASAGAAEKQLVRVRGQFRGRNLFGDLPGESRRGSSDWVIQDQGVAVWVTGKAPKGSGWSLDLDSRSESVRWVEVEGEVAARDGFVYVKAKSVSLVAGPVAAAKPDVP
jgi:hypothetical protein